MVYVYPGVCGDAMIILAWMASKAGIPVRKGFSGTATVGTLGGDPCR